MKLESVATILDFDPYSTRTQPEATHNMGESVTLADQRKFRYAKAGASNISHGKLQLGPVPKTNHHNIAVYAAAAIGATQVQATLGATAAIANEYSEGYLCVNDATGAGYTYKISSHPAVAQSGVITLTLFDPIKVALVAATSKISLIHNTYNGVVEGTSATQSPAGVPYVDISAGDYGWLQTRGVCAVLNGASVTLGARLMADGTTAGAVTDQTDVTAPQTEWQVGFAITVGVSTQYKPIFLTID